METPVCDFVESYQRQKTVRMHMPGHKGQVLVGPEALDITEIQGADELYRPEGILQRSEEEASRLFGSGRTVYSVEGSSLCIRAMLMLACWRAREKGIPLRIAAGRNAHRTLMSAAALLDLEVRWILPGPEEGLLSCRVTPEKVEEMLRQEQVMAVYVTSPDYLGHLTKIDALARVCHRHDTLLLVDNAHGAYLRFLPRDLHPLSLGADMCCDSAHKTLPCLTGAAYLHLSAQLDEGLRVRAEQAMALFGSTSPSYLILQSLDRVNALLAGKYGEQLVRAVKRLDRLRQRLLEQGWKLEGEEPLKLTLTASRCGVEGTVLSDKLREHGIECEFSDRDYVTLMPSAWTREEDWQRLEQTLLCFPAKEALPAAPPSIGAPRQVCSIREAMFSPSMEVPVEDALGRILADAHSGCPPAVPVRIAGERLDEEALRCFRYYGITTCRVLCEAPGEQAPQSGG